MLGQVTAVEIARTSEAAIKVGAELQSLFQRDQSAIRTILRNDVQMRRRTSGAVIEKVTWGA